MRALSLSFLLLLLLTGCRPDVSTFSAFQSIDEEGWWREDTLTFTVDTLQPATRYAVTLSLRTAAAPDVYPYTDLTLAVRHTETDTLRLTLATARGDDEGRGTSLYQYDFLIDTLSIDSTIISPTTPLTISVFHLMRRDPLPGIRDVGVQLRAL